MRNIDLEIRLSHSYVGTWKHLDRWHSIGSAVEIGTEELPREEDLEDPCDPQSHRVFLKVATDDPQPARRIKGAIIDVYTSHGCDHEYDCCGCRSFSCDEVKHEGGPIWSAVVSSSRNY
jgi:hypothetical protein